MSMMTKQEREELEREIQAKEDKLREEHEVKLPDGLDFVFFYKDGLFPYINENLVQEEGEVRSLRFCVDLDNLETLPALPLIMKGEAWTVGWDIPTRWAIDAHKKCWMDDAHGGSLNPVEEGYLLSLLREDGRYSLNGVCTALGRKPPLPEWMSTALQAGWTPPDGWDRSEYDD